MDIYAVTTILLALLAVLLAWRFPTNISGYLVFFVSFLPLVYRQGFIDGEPQIAAATFVVATTVGVVQLLRRRK
jgi:hypothetical protein